MYATVVGALLYVGEKDLVGTAVTLGIAVNEGEFVPLGADVGAATGWFVQPALMNGL